jgi:hypothetical protein
VSQCYECAKDNPDGQAYCGSCGSPLALNEYIARNVREQLNTAIRDRNVLEAESSIRVFMTAWGYAKSFGAVLSLALALFVALGIWKYSDLWSSINAAKQAVTDTSVKSVSEMRKGTAAVQLQNDAASREAARRSNELKDVADQTKKEMSKQVQSLKTSVEVSRSELQSVRRLEPEIDDLRKQTHRQV